MGEKSAALKDGPEASGLPAANPVEGAEEEVGRGGPLTADQFSASSNVIHQPRRHSQVIRVAADFTDVERESGNQVDDVALGGFHQEIGSAHRSPELGLHGQATELPSALLQCIHEELMGAEVGDVPIIVVREKDRPGLVLAEKVSDDTDGLAPGLWFAGAGLEIDALQAVGGGANEFEPDVIATGLQFLPALLLAGTVAALGHRHIDDLPFEFTEKAQRQGADDDFVVGMR